MTRNDFTWRSLWIYCWLSITVASVSGSESCTQLLSGSVGAGNYTYYRLAHEGEVALSLYSVVGDADVYVSQSTLQPTYESEDNDLQSVTCGEDRVDIPAYFRRPVGIGIYGHPFHDTSTYRLCVNLLSTIDRAYEYEYYDDDGDNLERNARPHVPFHYDKEEGEESLLWTVLIGILKVIVEVFM